ncbi:hypothetical protein [Eubacterium callanderi]|uniref:hypothetical protein n=1 Tax=Eubacterium callanderi TaxID=53442 RepID=UPI001FD41905|nr:hypothetical protein [Eubacterium callanderi]
MAVFDLKQWAAANKVSNSQLCRLSGVSECTIASVMRGCSCTERTLKSICRGIGRPYDPAEWRNPIKASLKPVPVVDYDRVRNYRDRRSMEELKRNLAVGETVRVQFQLRPLSKTGQRETRWENGTIIRIYENHVGVMVQLKTAHGNALSLRKSYMIDDVVKWKGNHAKD